MAMENFSATTILQKNARQSTLVILVSLLLVFLILLHCNNQISRFRDSVTFLPLIDVRFAETPMEGNTWFMSSLNETRQENKAEYLYFPSQTSKGRVLCIMGRDTKDGTKNSYALAWPEKLPNYATRLNGLSFVSDAYHGYQNLLQGLYALTRFIDWSMKNDCLRPNRWVLFHRGELRDKMGPWLHQLMESYFGQVEIEGFRRGDGPYCFERAVVMRHNQGSIGKARKLKEFDLLRSRARSFCGLNPAGKGFEVNKTGDPIIRLTLLMTRGSRSFKNHTAVIRIFEKECKKVNGCVLKVSQFEDLSFCEQVRVMTNTDIVATTHGAQLTNMLLMDDNSSIMEFFPKGWFKLAGFGKYVYKWMAEQAGMRYRGAWWDPGSENECSSTLQDSECFIRLYKDGLVGHNETYFAEWASSVLKQVRISKLKQAAKILVSIPEANSGVCLC